VAAPILLLVLPLLLTRRRTIDLGVAFLRWRLVGCMYGETRGNGRLACLGLHVLGACAIICMCALLDALLIHLFDLRDGGRREAFLHPCTPGPAACLAFGTVQKTSAARTPFTFQYPLCLSQPLQLCFLPSHMITLSEERGPGLLLSPSRVFSLCLAFTGCF
jgi:hypothetical protein